METKTKQTEKEKMWVISESKFAKNSFGKPVLYAGNVKKDKEGRMVFIDKREIILAIGHSEGYDEQGIDSGLLFGEIKKSKDDEHRYDWVWAIPLKYIVGSENIESNKEEE